MAYSVCDLNNQQIFDISDELWQKNRDEKQLLLRYLAIPIQENNQTLWLAIDDLNNLNALEIFAFVKNKQIEPILISSEELKYLLAELTPQTTVFYEESDILTTPANIESVINHQDPIIQLLDNLFHFCLKQNVSDIHLEPNQSHFIIRVRIDGVLHLYNSFQLHFAQRIISRLKLLAKLDISESRLPQDGQFSFTTILSDTLDFRVSTLPTHFGEKMVLRLQKNKPIHLDFLDLGFNPQQKSTLLSALNKPQGLILVTGPTGSGKSITLYSALNYLNQPHKHILTAEDPIEIILDGIIQTQVNKAIQLDFSDLLRTFLRQDPDIIMLGEIRDEASAKMALNAAQTGHLVLSTLHTNDAPSAIERLLQLGIKEYELKNSLLLIIAQRLLRRLCSKCQGKSCEHCYDGYKGRIGTFQLYTKKGENFSTETAILDFPTLNQSAKEKIQLKMTNLTEVIRVLGDENDL